MQGIQLVKQVQRVDDPRKQEAAVAIYFGRLDEAEALYRRLDRLDLALDMRARLGDWFTVRCQLEDALCSVWGQGVHGRVALEHGQKASEGG